MVMQGGFGQWEPGDGSVALAAPPRNTKRSPAYAGRRLVEAFG